MSTTTTTGTLAAGESKTFTLAPGAAVSLTLSPNIRVTITETPESVSGSGVGGNTSRVHEPQLPGTFAYGPYAMGGVVVVAVASYSGSSVAWTRKDTVVTTSSDGTSLVSGDEKFPFRTGGTTLRADVIVYGATPSGIMAAIAAKKQGVSALLISPNGRIGGMLTGGLARTDYRGYNPRVGMNVGTADFFRRAALHYGFSLGYYGMDGTSPYAIEPKVALAIYEDLLQEYQIPVLRNYRVTAVNKEAGDIKSITVAHRTASDTKSVSGLVFIDASYNCDLLIRSGASYQVGREANATYSETYNGVRASAALTGNPSPYLTAGDAGSGLLPNIDANALEAAGTADTRLMAFCHRPVMTNDPSIRLSIPEPDTYNPLLYEVIGRGMANSPTLLDSLNEVFFRAAIPLGGTQKQDWNNLGATLNYVGGNFGFVSTDYAAQDAIELNHKNYTLGLFKFLREDSRVPAALKTAMLDWGFCSDEFVGEGTGGLSPELYVRESARMVGDYVMTEANWAKSTSAAYPVALCTYAMDSHGCSLRNVGGVAHTEGGLSSSLVPVGYYGMEYRCMLPKAHQVGNMLVCGNGISASHTLFGSARIETTQSSMGEAAGVAAALSIISKYRLHDIAGSDIQPFVRHYDIHPDRILTINAPSTNGTATLSSVPPSGWTYETFPPEFYATRLVNEGNGNKGGRWAQFEPTFAADGRYRIMLNAPGAANAQLRCKVDVTHVGGVETFYIDHKYGEWHFRDLGVWEFSTTVGTIRVTNAADPAVSGSGNGILSVDGVAWHPVP